MPEISPGQSGGPPALQGTTIETSVFYYRFKLSAWKKAAALNSIAKEYIVYLPLREEESIKRRFIDPLTPTLSLGRGGFLANAAATG